MARSPFPLRFAEELRIEKGRKLLWEKLSEHEIRIVILPEIEPRGARAMLGFARRFRSTLTTQDWMNDLRDNET